MHLELPEDIAAEETSAEVFTASLVRRPMAEEKAIRKAVELIESARHPLLVIGAGANRKLTCRMLRQFVDKTGIPFVTTQMGKGVVDERDPRFFGNAALSDNDFIHRAIEHADLIINVGHDVVEKPPFFMRHDGRQVIHVNFFSAQVDPVYFPQVEVVGDIANSIWQICERHRAHKAIGTSRTSSKVREAAEAQFAEGADDARFPYLPAATRRRRAQGDACRWNHRVGQRRLQNLVRSQLQGKPAQHGLARQCLGDAWEPDCHRRWRRGWCFPIAKSWRFAATAVS